MPAVNNSLRTRSTILCLNEFAATLLNCGELDQTQKD